MKKIFLPLIVILMSLSCSTDETTETPETTVPDVETNTDNDTSDNEMGVLRILEVDAVNDQVVLTNLGNATLDASSYFLCLGPGTYAAVSGLVTSDTTIAPNETLTFTYDVNEDADGLSVFSTNDFGSSDPLVLLDYIQWGAASQARVSQAVTAGRWDSTDSFVPQSSNYTYTGDAQDVGVNFWE